MYSIVIPYLSKNNNFDKCVSYIEKNSLYSYEIVPIKDETDVYYAYNSGVYKAKYDKVVLMNDDMVVSKNWDELLVPFCDEKRVLTFNVVEKNPDYDPIGPNCLHFDCGDNFENFDEDKFDKFIEYHKRFHRSPEHGKGWYMPIVFHKRSFISYPNINKFPYPNDVTLIDKILPNNGYTFIKMPRYIYHFAMRATKERLENENTRDRP